MAELNCVQLQELGPELALGVLAGRDRARVIAHLQDCPACEQHVRELTVVGDRLVALVPGAEPPVGFEQRVLDRLGLRTRRPWRRRWIVAAAALLGIGLASVGWVLHGAMRPGDPDLTNAAITADGGAWVGKVFAYSDQPSWLYVDLSSTQAHGTVTCQVHLADGRVVTIGSFPVSGGSAQWAGLAPLTGTQLLEVRILAEDGSVIGTARFG